MKLFLLTIAAAAAGTFAAIGSLPAQTADAAPREPRHRWELLVPSGTLIPTGVQGNAIKRGNLSAVQVIYAARPSFAVTSTFGWARSRDVAAHDNPKLDVFSYDLGAELRSPRRQRDSTFSFRPFAGVGIGGRTYNHRTLDVDATHNVAAYAGVGGELGIRRIRLRLEARDYVTGFKPLGGAGASRTGNDVVVMVGLGFGSR